MAKRIGWARIKALINENTGTGLGTHRNWVMRATGSTTAGIQGSTGLVVGKNLDSSAKPAIANPFAESSTQLWDFGTLLHYGDRTYRYAGIGSGAVTAGKLLQAAALTNANHRDIAVQAAAAAGTSEVSVTVGGDTDSAINLFAGGYLHCNDVAGQGQLLRIKSHEAHDFGVDGATLTLTLHDAVDTALTTSTKVDLITNPYNDLIVAPTTFTGPVIGVTAMDMTANYFGWVQIAGPCSVGLDVNPTGATEELGGLVIRSDDTAGFCMGIGVVTGDADLAHQVIGTLMVNNGDTDNVVVWLNHL